MVEGRVIIGDSRQMLEVQDTSVDLVVTSPPYWHIKDYGVDGQIGFGQTLHNYLQDLCLTWKDCYRVLKPGSRLCINIGDQFLRSVIYGRYKIAPLHSEFISQCEKVGFDYMGAIIWQKKTTMNTTGGAAVMGSYPYPPNGLIEIDYEFILLFKKPGKREVSKEIKEKSKMSKEEWRQYFSGHWAFAGERQGEHEAMFPEELPKRLVKMFTFVGDVVLDPFLGSGTTIKMSLDLGRNGIGYEINPGFLPLIKKKIGMTSTLFNNKKIEVLQRREKINVKPFNDYIPAIQDANPVISPDKFKFKEKLYKVTKIKDKNLVELDTGLNVKLHGLNIIQQKSSEAIKYLEEYVKGKQVFLKFEPSALPENEIIPAYIFLKNKIFINKEMVKSGLAEIDDSKFMYKENFLKAKLGV
ncbi:MAG: site-specific DNA-methyltransferase [Candidatus Diapherotrites archaeon]|uniref:Type II methyltransferase n=1 Tax=Candidatus Iainarchaeum sp. TaxID=3101447 RepID=A0A8T3YNZ4_9ARCH|nr:site-specific DNA-methyltransferase [Candidatus Diapherotrites archaeon]